MRWLRGRLTPASFAVWMLFVFEGVHALSPGSSQKIEKLNFPVPRSFDMSWGGTTICYVFASDVTGWPLHGRAAWCQVMIDVDEDSGVIYTYTCTYTCHACALLRFLSALPLVIEIVHSFHIPYTKMSVLVFWVVQNVIWCCLTCLRMENSVTKTLCYTRCIWMLWRCFLRFIRGLIL